MKVGTRLEWPSIALHLPKGTSGSVELPRLRLPDGYALDCDVDVVFAPTQL